MHFHFNIEWLELLERLVSITTEELLTDCRLQDYCERLMFYDPLEYGRKAEELLWRKVYYDVIQLLKHNRKVHWNESACQAGLHFAAFMTFWSDCEDSGLPTFFFFGNFQQMRPSSSLESAFRTHLAAATGYYHHLLFKLQTEFSLRLDGTVDLYHVPEPKTRKLSDP